MRRRRVAAGVAVAILAGMTGCSAAAPQPTAPPVDFSAVEPGDGNGLWLMRDDALLAEVVAAVRRGGPVAMTGTVTELVVPESDDPSGAADPVPGRTLSLDYAGRPDAFAATLGGGDVSAEILVDGGTTRLRPNAAYAARLGRDVDTVVCTVGADAAVSAWAPLTDPAALLEALLAGGALSASRPVDQGDDTVEVAIGSGETVVGVLEVDRFGPPLPRRLTLADLSGDADLAFAWGETVDLAARAAALPCP
ncbi:hypothetical protein ET445_07040 [Agromyces protaetiae]|uniref:LppX_LprAFG lipoprotein n=1 Tax=Agromyces protaetiae TaxID=2509455 RepID=A0A4P6FRI1_9MICO|nr:hypothetical protein [Agromyces protaetiae]QAY73138.1 hypothetical protein ET445_07040 [Agromyces protaetiae]